ncbi:MAG: minor capsid protein [Firmicutes bacterium]|nr:minor capsid protein [Bacillota bacterium]
MQDSAKAIAKDFNTTINRAATLVYTETAHAASMAQKEGFEELGVEEFEIVATLDNVTSEICQEMDGKHLPMSEFKAGVTAPPFHPNCRSVTAPYFEDSEEIFGVTERAARDPETGKTVYVDDMTYPEWKEKFVKNLDTKNIANSAKSDIMKTGSDVMALENQRYGRNKDTAINHNYIKSGEYRRKFDKATSNPKVNKSLYDCAKKALTHRSGTLLEDMYWIDGTTGKVIAKELDSTEPRKIKYSNSTKEKIESADAYSIVALHSHPSSMPPSADDFNSCYDNKYQIGFVSCHNGKLFAYTSEQKISKKLYEMYIENFIESGYTDYEAQIETLKKLIINHEIDFWEVE